METSGKLKEIVKQKYGEIALQEKAINQSSCCGAGACSAEVYNIMSDDYTEMKGYNADADLGLGCGLPTQFAKIKKGDLVIDLGSGAGNDCFIAIQKQAYLELIEINGFQQITIQKEKSIYIPDDILNQYLTVKETESFRSSDTGIFSITVSAEKNMLLSMRS